MTFRKPSFKFGKGRRANEAAAVFSPERADWRAADTQRESNRKSELPRRDGCRSNPIGDMGNAPIAFDLDTAAVDNEAFRRIIWTGRHLQLSLMSVMPGESVGEEVHEGLDQTLYVVSGEAELTWGKLPGKLNNKKHLRGGYLAVIPQMTYHNVYNAGGQPLKLLSTYAPKAHPFGLIET